jgi:hypothetical protein
VHGSDGGNGDSNPISNVSTVASEEDEGVIDGKGGKGDVIGGGGEAGDGSEGGNSCGSIKVSEGIIEGEVGADTSAQLG